MVDTDVKLPQCASRLAVRAVGGGDKEFLGSFDVLLRIRAARPGLWRKYDGGELALDCKLTGVSTTLGLNGMTLRTYTQNARAVVSAARNQGLRVGRCGLVAFLLRRPPGHTQQGLAHRGGFGFVAFETDVLLNWDPTSNRPPRTFTLSGSLLQGGQDNDEDALALQRAPPARAPQRDRWAELSEAAVRTGWVKVTDFVNAFSLRGRASEKKATEKALKRLRQGNGALDDTDGGVVGRPHKIARLSDLKRLYPDLR